MLAKADALRAAYDVTVLPQAKKLGKQFGTLEGIELVRSSEEKLLLANELANIGSRWLQRCCLCGQ